MLSGDGNATAKKINRSFIVVEKLAEKQLHLCSICYFFAVVLHDAA